jgi:hypothetical protein
MLFHSPRPSIPARRIHPRTENLRQAIPRADKKVQMSTHSLANAQDRPEASPPAPTENANSDPARDEDMSRTPLPANLNAAHLPPDSRDFLDRVVNLNLLTRSSAGRFLDQAGAPTVDLATPDALGEALVRAGLLTEYQVSRVLGGMTYGLHLGNYRILERIGAGGMSCVFLAEHCLMKRRVAIKVLPMDDDCPSSVRDRFYAEMRVQAELHHPHIALAFDASPRRANGCGKRRADCNTPTTII